MTTTRKPTGQFVKGQSGNPTGKPKVLTALDATGAEVDVNELFRVNAAAVFTKLYQTIMSPKTGDAPRVTAIREYFDRAFGKPPKTISARVTETEDEFDLTALPLEVQAHIVALRERNAEESD